MRNKSHFQFQTFSGVCPEPGGVPYCPRKQYDGPYHYGHQVTYHCFNGTKHVIVCKEDGAWASKHVRAGTVILPSHILLPRAPQKTSVVGVDFCIVECFGWWPCTDSCPVISQIMPQLCTILWTIQSPLSISWYSRLARHKFSNCAAIPKLLKYKFEISCTSGALLCKNIGFLHFQCHCHQIFC